MSKSHAVYAHVKHSSSGKGPATRQHFHGTEDKRAAAALEEFITSHVGSVKTASVASTVATGLQLRDALVSSHSYEAGSAMRTPPGKVAATSADIDPGKIAAAVLALDRLTSLVSELQEAHDSSAKVAAALAGAVKLAQDGVIDTEDIVDIARESIERGSVKLSAIDELFAEQPGELVEGDAPETVKAATGRPLPGFGDASGRHDQTDVLTATLRSLRTE
jgi:hypothetical protein